MSGIYYRQRANIYLVMAMMIASFLNAGSFFGAERMKKTSEGVMVEAEGTPLPLLLNEWCQLCEESCIVDHDIKQKLSLNVKNMSCADLLSVLSEGVAMQKIASTIIFQKKNKGSWEGYHCVFRSPSEIAKLLSGLLSSSKSEQILSDDLSGWLWIPKDFYRKHINLIEHLDQQKSEYVLRLALLRVSESLMQDIRVGHKESMAKWAWGGSFIVKDLFDIIQGKDQEGVISTVSEITIRLLEEEKAVIQIAELFQGERLDKKGKASIIDIPEATKCEVSFTKNREDKLALSLVINDGYLPVDQDGSKQSDIIFKNVIIMNKGEDILLGGISRVEHSKKQQCLPIVGRVPLFGRFFCRVKKQYNTKHYALVLTVTSV